MEILTTALMTIFTTALTTLIGYGIDYLRASKKIMITESQEKFLKDSAIKAVHYIEEIAEDRKKEGKEKYSSLKKLEIAENYLMKKVPKLTHDEAHNEIIPALSMHTKLGATGSKNKLKDLSGIINRKD